MAGDSQGSDSISDEIDILDVGAYCIRPNEMERAYCIRPN